ncbi:MAG: hypothetical protein J6O49_11330, partial [Bacteroidaceae bacterium]|nr:hypothetical protein [Bacteroidaceae bacterium]
IARHVYNPIIINFEPLKDESTGDFIRDEDGDIKTCTRHYIVTTTPGDREMLDSRFISRCKNAYFCIIAPILFRGWSRSLGNAERCFGIGIDLDHVDKPELMHQVIINMTRVIDGHKWWPIPNIVTNSGHGLHLYFLFEKSVDIHTEDQQNLMKKLKYGLINRIWNVNSIYGFVSSKSEVHDVQRQGITQGFRPPESLTKFQVPVVSFALKNQVYHTVRELNEFISSNSKYKLTDAEVEALESGKQYDPSKTKLEVAKKLWPDWYQRRILNKEPIRKWNPEPRLYDFALRMITDYESPIAVGHRYYCLRMLAIIASKCKIPYSQLKKDADRLLPRLKGLADPNDSTTKFKDEDRDAALSDYFKDNVYNFKWEIMLEKTGLEQFYGSKYRKLTKEQKQAAEQNRLDQDTHLLLARQRRDTLRARRNLPKWDLNNGRPVGSFTPAENSTQAQLVKAWRMEHPDSTNKSQCVKDIKTYIESLKKGLSEEEQKNMKVMGTTVAKLHISRPSVIKWWSVIEEEEQAKLEQGIIDDIT